MSGKYDALKLENQICFPLYACSKEIVRHYRPFLEKLDLTYTQYITMMVMWEEHQVSIKHLGERLFLDSGTLTPVVKSLESKGYVTRKRNAEDERVLDVTLTPEGEKLRDEAIGVPEGIASCSNLTPEEGKQLYLLLYKLLGDLN